MAGRYMTSDEWALLVVAVTVAVMALIVIIALVVSAVTARKGGRR